MSQIDFGLYQYVRALMIIASDHILYASFFRIILVNVNKLAENCDLFTFPKEILNGKLHFL